MLGSKQSALKAGALYFAIVFAIGFVLGTIRVFFLVPKLGETLSVAIEVPFMLTASWIVCARLTKTLRIVEMRRDRLIMGVSAFTFLIAAEIGLSIFAFGRTVPEHFAAYQERPQFIGLIGQLLFASLPIVQMHRGR